jgi:hypothetical protein
MVTMCVCVLAASVPWMPIIVARRQSQRRLAMDAGSSRAEQ